MTAPTGPTGRSQNEREVKSCTANHTDAHLQMYFPPFFGFCLHSHCWTLNVRGCRAMKEANTLQGESKNHSPLFTTQFRLIKSYYSVLLFLCFYIYIDYFSMSVLIFFFFLLFKFPKSWEFLKNAVFICCLPQ